MNAPETPTAIAAPSTSTPPAASNAGATAALSTPTPPAPTPPPAKFSINEKGEFGENWHASEAIPEALRGNKALGQHRSIETLAKSYVEAQQLRGKPIDSLVELPSKDATPEQIRAFHGKLGVPEKPEEYLKAIKLPDVLGKDYKPSDEFLKSVHEAGFTPKQLEGVMHQYGALVTNMKEAQAKAETDAIASTEKAMKQHPVIGKDLPYAMKLATAALTDFETANGIAHDSPEMQATILQIRQNPLLVQMLHHFGQSYKESPLHMGASTTGQSIHEQRDALTAKLAAAKPLSLEYKTFLSQWNKANEVIAGMKAL